MYFISNSADRHTANTILMGPRENVPPGELYRLLKPSYRRSPARLRGGRAL